MSAAVRIRSFEARSRSITVFLFASLTTSSAYNLSYRRMFLEQRQLNIVVTEILVPRFSLRIFREKVPIVLEELTPRD